MFQNCWSTCFTNLAPSAWPKDLLIWRLLGFLSWHCKEKRARVTMMPGWWEEFRKTVSFVSADKLSLSQSIHARLNQSELKVLIWGSCRKVTSTPNNQLVSLTCWQLTSYEFAKELCMKLPACHECPSKPRCPPQPPEFEGPSVHLTAESGAQSSLAIP